MRTLARGGTVGFDNLTDRERELLKRHGIESQKDADNLNRGQVQQLERRIGETRTGRHPLGAGAEQGEDYRKRSVRDALKYVLRLYYAHTIPGEVVSRVGDPFAARMEVGSALSEKVSSSGDARVGMQLADRFVSRLEIGFALDLLAMEYPSLHVILQLRYEYGWTRKRVAGQVGIGRDTLANREDEALDVLIQAIWR